jgi:hypothetical protein
VFVLRPPNNTSAIALYVNRKSVGPLLRLPVNEAIGTPKSPLPKIGGRVNSHLYQWDPSQVEQLPDSSFVLPLNRPPSPFGSG